MSEIIEENGEITVKDSEKFDKDGLLEQYRRDDLVLRMLEKQISNFPNHLKQLQGEKQISEHYLSKLDTKILQIEESLKSKGVNVKEELKKLKEQFSEDALLEKAKGVGGKEETKYSNEGEEVKKVSEVTYSVEDLVLLYASNNYYKLQCLESLARVEENIQKVKEQNEVRKKELQKMKEKQASIKRFFKNKGENLNKLLEKQAKNRKKEDKMAQELPLK